MNKVVIALRNGKLPMATAPAGFRATLLIMTAA
jgi:hypothetical protein